MENPEEDPSDYEYQQQLRGFLGISFHCDSNYFVASLRLGERETTNHANRRECSVGTESDLRRLVWFVVFFRLPGLERLCECRMVY